MAAVSEADIQNVSADTLLILQSKPREIQSSFTTIGAQEVNYAAAPAEDQPSQGAIVANGLINENTMANRQHKRRADRSGREYYPDGTDKAPSMFGDEIVFVTRGKGSQTDSGVATALNGLPVDEPITVVGITDHSTRVQEGINMADTAAQDVAFQVGGRGRVYAGPTWCPVGCLLRAVKPLIARGPNGTYVLPNVIIGDQKTRFLLYVEPMLYSNWGGGFEENQRSYLSGAYTPDASLNPLMYNLQLLLHMTTVAVRGRPADGSANADRRWVVIEYVMQRIASQAKQVNGPLFTSSVVAEMKSIADELKRTAGMKAGITADTWNDMAIINWGFIHQARLQDAMIQEQRAMIVGRATTPGRNCAIGINVNIGAR